jgi:hypothetical protein
MVEGNRKMPVVVNTKNLKVRTVKDKSPCDEQGLFI